MVALAASTVHSCVTAVHHLSLSPTMTAGSDPQNNSFPNHRGSAQGVVTAFAAAVEVEEVEGGMLAQQTLGDKAEVVKAALAYVVEAVNTRQIASVRCDIVAAARSLESPAQAQCRVMCY